MSAGADHFAAIMEPVARLLLGDPNRALSSKRELRFGTHGSMAVDLEKGVFFAHDGGEGGGVLALIEAQKGLRGREAIEWLRANGFDVPDEDRPVRNGARGAAHPAPAKSAAPARSAPAANPPPAAPKPRLVKTYPYVDAAGALVFEVCRYEPKTFRQRRPARPDDDLATVRDGWVWSVKGLTQVPYRLPELIDDVAAGATVFVVEGEKDVDRLRSLGVPATCNAMGAGKWPDELSEHFAGADVVLLPDNDPQARRKSDDSLLFHPDGRPVHPGQDHMEMVGGKLALVAARVRVLELPDLPPKGDASDWIAAGGTADALYDLVEARAVDFADWVMARPGAAPWDDGAPAPGGEPGPFVSRFNARPWAHLDDAAEPHEWLIKGVLSRGEVAMMAGPSGSGKTFLAMDLAMAIARGADWFGCRVRAGGVIYQAGEGKRGLFKRLKAYRQENGLSLADNLPLVVLPAHLDLYSSDEHAVALIAEIRHWATTFTLPLELVVIDTFGAATAGADENASRDMGPVLARCVRISEECACAVLLIHHMNAGGQKARGWTGIQANVDSVIGVAKTDPPVLDNDRRHIREFTLIKQKDGEDGRKWSFVLPGIEIARDADGEPVTSCVVRTPNGDREPGGRDGAGDAGVKLSAQCELFLRAIVSALEDYGEDAPPRLGLPRGTKVAQWAHVRAAFAALGFEGDAGDDEKKRAAVINQAAKRHGEKLMQLRIIMREAPYVWLTGRKVRGVPVAGYAPSSPAGREGGA